MSPHRFQKILSFFLLSAALISLSACSFPKKRPTDQSSGGIELLTIATADSGGTMYPVGKAIASALEHDHLKCNLSASTGSAMNIRSLIGGEVDLALVSGDIALAARESGTPGTEKLSAISAVFFSQSNWLAPVESDAVYVHDLIGKQLGIGPEDSSTELAAQTALRSIGLDEQTATLVNCGLGKGTEAVLRGELDAIHGFSGPPIGNLGQLAQERPCRVLKYTPEELTSILSGSTIYLPATLHAGTYAGQTEPVDSFGVKCLLCVDASMDEKLVHDLTAALWENREALRQAHPALTDFTDPSFLFENLPIPLHPGAERFCAEMFK